MNRPTCETCVYWDDLKRPVIRDGLCRRRSPDPETKMLETMHAEEWCGDHHLFQSYIASLSSGEAAIETEPPQVEVPEGIPDELYMLWVHGSDEQGGYWAHPIDTTRGGGDLYLVTTDYETAKIAAKEQMEKYPNLGTIFAVKVL